MYVIDGSFLIGYLLFGRSGLYRTFYLVITFRVQLFKLPFQFIHSPIQHHGRASTEWLEERSRSIFCPANCIH